MRTVIEKKNPNGRLLSLTLGIQESWYLALEVNEGVTDDVVQDQLLHGWYSMKLTDPISGKITITDSDDKIIATGAVDYDELQGRCVVPE